VYSCTRTVHVYSTKINVAFEETNTFESTKVQRTHNVYSTAVHVHVQYMCTCTGVRR
jgi:hypothetical protein